MRTIAVTLTAAMYLSTLAQGQSGTTRPATSTSVGRFTAIGCVSRQGTAAAPRYVVTDTRGDTPTVYRLDGDAALLARHVGHRVEVAGPLGPPRAGTAQRILKVSSVVWLSTSPASCAGGRTSALP